MLTTTEWPRPGSMLYSVASGVVNTQSHADSESTRHPVSSVWTTGLPRIADLIASYDGLPLRASRVLACTSADEVMRRPKYAENRAATSRYGTPSRCFISAAIP